MSGQVFFDKTQIPPALQKYAKINSNFYGPNPNAITLTLTTRAWKTDDLILAVSAITPSSGWKGQLVNGIHLLETSITQIPQLPDQIEYLEVHDTPLKDIVGLLPPNLVDLYIYNANLQSLPDLPSSLKKLALINIPNLSEVPPIGKNLKKLTLERLGIRSLPCVRSHRNAGGNVLPDKTIEVSLRDLRIETLNTLPDAIHKLYILEVYVEDTTFHYRHGPLNFLNIIASNLQNIDISRASTSTLMIDDCPDLETLGPLPNSIRSLSIKKAKIKTLPNIPQNLGALTIDETNLHTLQELPNTTNILHLQNNDLRDLPELPITAGNYAYITLSGNKLTKFPRFKYINEFPLILELNLNNNKINEIDEQALPHIQTLKMDNNLITTIPATALTDSNHVISLGGNPLREPFLSMYTEYKDMARVNIFQANNFLRDNLASFWGSYAERENIAANARNIAASRVLHQNKRLGNTGLVPEIQSYLVRPENFVMNKRTGKATNATLKKLQKNYNARAHTLPPVEFNVNANAMRRMYHETRPQTEGEPTNFGAALRRMFGAEGGSKKKRKTLRKQK